MALRVHPITPDRWPDLVSLFDKRAGSDPASCWCMYLRVPSTRMSTLWGAGARAAMDELVASGQTPGLLAYDGDRAVGWVSVAAKEDFGRLLRSPAYRNIDGEPVWSVVCFVVATDQRGAARGVADALLHGAVDHARNHGATMLEAYPYDAPNTPVHGAAAWRGPRTLYERHGFREVARRSPNRPIMRKALQG